MTRILLSCLLLFSICHSHAQGTACEVANPFCSDSSYYFENISNDDGIPNAPSGPNYGCLGSEPNPVWYYMQIGTAGTMQLTVTQTSTAGNGIDADFALWGPFTSLEEGCVQVMSGAVYPIQCSYDGGGAPEIIGLGLPGGSGVGAGWGMNPPGGTIPPEGQVGEVYILLLTNWNGSPGNFSFEQTDGTGSADCGIVCGLSASSSGNTCQGQPVSLFASTTDTVNSFTYYWSGSNGFSATGQNVTDIPQSSGTVTYSVMSVNQIGDTCFATTTNTVFPLYHNVTNQEICLGETYTFFDQVIFQPGTYDSMFTSINGCDSLITLNLTVNPLPEVTISASANGICEGDSTVIRNEEPSTFATYQWYNNDNPIQDATADAYAATEAGNYFFVGISDKNCTDTSNTVPLQVYPPAVAEITGVSRQDVCFEDTVTISAKAVENSQYHWSPEKVFRSDASYFYQNATATVTDWKVPVYLMVMNSYGCRAYDTAMLTGHPCCDVYTPTAFSPNGDGLNDYFMPKLRPYQVISSFTIFDRYGKLVYENKNPQKGWDGYMPSGEQAAQDTYMYMIQYTCTDGQTYTDKGDVILVR